MKYGKVTLGQIEAVLNRLGGEDGVQKFLAGQIEIVVSKHRIECGVLPSIPQGFGIIEHRIAAPIEWNIETVHLHLHHDHETILSVYNKRRSTVLNAAVLDYLLAHQAIIPEFWKRDGYIYFWGTIYQQNSTPGSMFVKQLHWRSEGFGGQGKWISSLDRVDERQWSRLNVSVFCPMLELA